MPWGLHLAHLASGSGKFSRVDDRRAVILLCPLAHMLHVHNRRRTLALRINGKTWPTLDDANTIWLKRAFDSGYYDWQFIKAHWTGEPPEPEPPHSVFLEMLQDNVGVFW